MPRSSYIYTVQSGETILAAFTVKRELTHWLSRPGRRGFTIFRLPDGGGTREPVNITAEFHG